MARHDLAEGQWPSRRRREALLGPSQRGSPICSWESCRVLSVGSEHQREPFGVGLDEQYLDGFAPSRGPVSGERVHPMGVLAVPTGAALFDHLGLLLHNADRLAIQEHLIAGRAETFLRPRPSATTGTHGPRHRTGHIAQAMNTAAHKTATTKNQRNAVSTDRSLSGFCNCTVPPDCVVGSLIFPP